MKNDTTLTLDEIIYPDISVRFGALVLDALILFALFVPLSFLEGYGKNIHICTTILNIVVAFVYHVYLVQRYGGTPGKLILGMKIVKLNAEPITWKEAFLRYSVQLLELIVTGIMAIYALAKADNAHYISLGWVKRSGYISSFYPDLIQIKMFGKRFMEIHWVSQIYSLWTLAEIIAVLANTRKRAIHDFIAGTVVVRIGYHGNIEQPVTEVEQ